MRVGEMVYNILKGVEEKRAVGTQRFYKGGWGTRGGSVSIQVTPFFMVPILCAASKFNISQLP